MTWLGKEVRTKEDFGRLFMGLADSPEDIAVFLEKFQADYPEDTDKILGYLTREAPPEYWEKLETMFGVKHPFGEYKGVMASFAAGMALGESVKNTGKAPKWLEQVLNIPRESMRMDYGALQP
jgi:hypothetical protein